VLPVPAGLFFYVFTYRQAFNHRPGKASFLYLAFTFIDFVNSPYGANRNVVQSRYHTRTSGLSDIG
jgi:hypothetical protein